MRGGGRINQLGADCFEASEGTLFVGANQPRVTRHIRGENGSKAAGRRHFAGP
jgi:hypothetical protein